MAEHCVYTAGVVGSSPAGPTMVINVQSLRFAGNIPPLALSRGTLALGSVCRSCGESVVSFSFSPDSPCGSEPLVRVELRESMPEYVEGLGSLTVVGVGASRADSSRTGSKADGGGACSEDDVAVDVDIVFDPDVEVLDLGDDALDPSENELDPSENELEPGGDSEGHSRGK